MTIVRNIAAVSARVSDKTVWTFVRIDTEDGCRGWGEATLQGSAVAVHRHVERLAPALIGQKLTSPVDVMEVVGTCGRDVTEAAAISALDQALWDVLAQARGETLTRALGSPLRSEIALYANVNRGTVDRSPAGFAARAREAVRRGFEAVKIAPFDGVQPGHEDPALLGAAIARIAAVRAAIGPEVRLMVDCHWRLSEGAASAVLREVEATRLYWLECPVPEDEANFAALRRLRHQANAMGVRLAGCEMMIGRAGFQPFLDSGVYDVIMPDVKYAGGVREMLRIGEVAARRGVACSPHNPSGPIAHAHSLHLSAHLSQFPFLELQYGESPLFFDFVTGELPDPQTGLSKLPPGAGLGLALGGEALRQRLVDPSAAAVRKVAP
jgi:galactonate dehydratase